MAAELTYVLDQSFSRYILETLKSSWVEPVGRVTSLTELGYAADAADVEWLSDLGRKGRYCVVTRDGAILRASIERRTWSIAGVSLLVLGKRWGLQPRAELGRRLLFWWPHMVACAEQGSPGAAWTVTHHVPDRPAKGIRPVTGPGA